MKLTDADVAEIIRILDATPHTELEIETDRFRITLQRGEDGGWRQQRESRAEPLRLDDAAVPTNETAQPTQQTETPAEDGLVAVPAPIVGTFYRSPQPGAAPFVEVGSRVEPDTVIAIIEVMKLMNTVRAGVRGTVTEILLVDGALAEYGETLLRVRKAG
jgi:acetyl-CoA carboxylase biotin carboxyl carrier protein